MRWTKYVAFEVNSRLRSPSSDLGHAKRRRRWQRFLAEIGSTLLEGATYDLPAEITSGSGLSQTAY